MATDFPSAQTKGHYHGDVQNIKRESLRYFSSRRTCQCGTKKESKNKKQTQIRFGTFDLQKPTNKRKNQQNGATIS